jgi:DNA-binding NtrC family response regulator
VTLTQPGIAAPENHAMVASRKDDPAQDPGAGRGEVPVFADPQSRSVASLVERVARTSVPVLITGETGSGKERLARYIHERSGRSGEFIVMQCNTALPGNDVRASQGPGSGVRITGMQPGRGAFGLKDGRGGTLFLDDVGELCPASQCELLRLLRESDVWLTEPDNANSSAVRVITSTSTELSEGVLKGSFRRDLFYRLNIATVRVPPLRQRPGDIVPLANHFLRLHSRGSNLPIRAFGQDALAALRRHPWPGNVRELENVIRFAVLTAPRRELRAEDLRLEDPHLATSGIAPGPDQDSGEPPPDELVRLLARRVRNPGAHLYDEVEGLLVAEAFRAAGGNQVHTATLLGISRNVVRTLLKKHGLLNSSRKVDR